MTETTTETELLDVKTEKPRGDCTGCKFDYQLGTARTGEFKGQLVIRKHNSRTGPGLCSGAQRPPKGAEFDELEQEMPHMAGLPDGEDAFTVPAHLHIFNDHDETGKYCACGAEEDDNGIDPDTVLSSEIGPTPHSMSDAIAAYRGALGLAEHTDHVVSEIQAGRVPDSLNQGAELGRMATAAFAGKEDPASPTFAVGVDPAGPSMAVATVPVQTISVPSPAAVTAPVSGMVAKNGEDQFTAPGPASDIPEGSVSMQPEPDRDRWGRYLILGQPHTRTTTFVKSASSTFTLNQWQQRMTVKGLTLRPDLLALAHGLDVKADKQQLNSIAEQAKEAAGQKVAANLGSAYHAFSERLDAGLITLDDIPLIYRHRLAQYQDVIRRAGLATRPEWIERTTAVRADQVSAALPVAGMLDRIWQLPNGELVIGDLKTGSDLSYGWGEITAQLAVYAHGVNTHGLFDWRTREWTDENGTGGAERMRVRTDFAIVMHLPADGDGCTLYRVDLVAGWRRAQICGRVMALNKEKDLAFPITVPDVVRQEAPAVAAPTPAIAVVPDDQAAWESAVSHFSNADSRARLAELYQFAMDSGKFTEQQLGTLAAIGQEQLQVLGLA